MCCVPLGEDLGCCRGASRPPLTPPKLPTSACVASWAAELPRWYLAVTPEALELLLPNQTKQYSTTTYLPVLSLQYSHPHRKAMERCLPSWSPASRYRWTEPAQLGSFFCARWPTDALRLPVLYARKAFHGVSDPWSYPWPYCTRTVLQSTVQRSSYPQQRCAVSEAATSALLLAWLFARPQGQMAPPDPAHQPSATALAHSTSGCWFCDDLDEYSRRAHGLCAEKASLGKYPNIP
ncbi:hypothetical protein J3F84DRAFT_354460 [Trichoderma pleuroticola]